jgi:hypothetical protein
MFPTRFVDEAVMPLTEAGQRRREIPENPTAFLSKSYSIYIFSHRIPWALAQIGRGGFWNTGCIVEITDR